MGELPVLLDEGQGEVGSHGRVVSGQGFTRVHNILGSVDWAGWGWEVLVGAAVARGLGWGWGTGESADFGTGGVDVHAWIFGHGHVLG
jgi:hypothetical protein